MGLSVMDDSRGHVDNVLKVREGVAAGLEKDEGSSKGRRARAVAGLCRR